jgi:ABC-type sugar transport system ATPase subunit
MVDSMLEMREVSKRYPGVLAVDRVNLTVLPGEVHVIAGENGAGKSTLMKILAGVEQPSTGTLELDGETVSFSSPTDAVSHGVAIIH